jgi:hypothetical protein
MIPATGMHRFISATAALTRKLLRRADRDRWIEAENFCPEWDERAKIIAGLIPNGSRVIEFGAGLSKLQSHLDPSCFYVASDLIRRRPDTLLVDLEERPLPGLADEHFDVAVFAGVLEYVSEVPGVVSWIGQYVTACVSSYECAPKTDGIYSHVKRTWDRAALGWVNSFTEEELKSIFTRAGFVCATQTLWNTQDGNEPIFVFRKVCPITGEAQNLS